MAALDPANGGHARRILRQLKLWRQSSTTLSAVRIRAVSPKVVGFEVSSMVHP
jgi:hypothetical protein